MIDPTKLLDQFLGGQRPGGAVGDILNQVTGALAGHQGAVPARRPGSVPSVGAQGGADMLAKAQEFLKGNAGGFAGGAAIGTLAGLVLGSKSGRKLAGNVAQIGALAVLGGLAYKAYTNYREGKPALGGPTAAEMPTSAPLALPGAPEPNAHALLLLRAMIAAAMADGVIDAQERSRILNQLEQAGLGGEEREFLASEIARPWTPAEFAAKATTPEMRSEIYLAALIAIDDDTAVEKAYLAHLAAALELEPGLTAHLAAAARAAKSEEAVAGAA